MSPTPGSWLTLPKLTNVRIGAKIQFLSMPVRALPEVADLRASLGRHHPICSGPEYMEKGEFIKPDIHLCPQTSVLLIL